MTVRRGLILGFFAVASLAASPVPAHAGCSLVVVAGSYSQAVPANLGTHEVPVNVGSQNTGSSAPVIAIHGCVAVPANIPKHPDPLHPVLH